MFIKKYIFLSVATCYLFLATHACAEESSLGIYPPITYQKIEPGEKVNISLNIQNFSSEAKTLDFSYLEFVPSSKSNGQIEYIKENERFTNFRENISLLFENQPIDRLLLSAQQKKDLLLKMQLPENQEAGDYTFSVIATERITERKADERSALTNNRIGIAANIIVSIPESTTSDWNIQDFSAKPFTESGPVHFTLLVENQNQNFIKPQGTIYIRNIFGQLVGKIALKSEVILAKSKRYLSSHYDTDNNLNLEWNEPFLLGSYQATVEISQNGESFNRSITFYAFPYRLFIILILVVILLLLIKKRVSHYLSS